MGRPVAPEPELPDENVFQVVARRCHDVAILLGSPSIYRVASTGAGASSTAGSGACVPASTYRSPLDHDATAATRQATIANANASCKPSRNGEEIRCGKNERPVSTAWVCAGRWASTELPSRCWIGL